MKSIAQMISPSLVLCGVLLLGSTCYSANSEPAQIFEKSLPPIPHETINTTNQNTIPFWKVLWDDARTSVHNKEYKDAATKYASLLEYKPNFDDVRKEYVSLLIFINDLQGAERHLNILLSHGANSLESQILQAELLLHSNRSHEAVAIYQDLYLKELGINNHNRIQHGLALSLAASGRNKEALKIFDELIVTNPKNDSIKKKAALVAIKDGNHDHAQRLIDQLSSSNGDDPELLEINAFVFEHKGELEQAAVLWQRLVAIEPGNSNANEALASHYRSYNNQAMEALHLERLLLGEHFSKNTLYRLVEVLLNTGRADRAIELCDISLEKFEENQDLLFLRRRAIKVLAEDLLIIVENEGTKLLWDDLIEVTKYRTEVYLKIAELLRKKENYNKLADVLILISLETPHNDPVWEELEYLLQKQGRSNELNSLYSLRKAKMRTGY